MRLEVVMLDGGALDGERRHLLSSINSKYLTYLTSAVPGINLTTYIIISLIYTATLQGRTTIPDFIDRETEAQGTAETYPRSQD